jgi:serine/threonine protein kinase
MRGVKNPEKPRGLEPTFVKGSRDPLADRLEPAADPLIGKSLIQRYKILELIGQGGMGNVYLAEDTRLGKKVAVKVLPGYIGKMSSVAERFVQEALLAPRIEHENIIDVTDRGKTADGVPFFVMEYLKGSDLSAALAKEGPLPWCERTQEIILQICRGLAAAHEKGIVHRDMKPENVFLVDRSDSSVFIKLFDFGIAKLLESAQGEGTPEQIPLPQTGKTLAGSVMGTPHYMAPEQASGADIDHRVDVYAVGTIMYEMVCGRVPFTLDAPENPMADALRILDMQKNLEPVPPRVLRPDLGIPQDVEGVILKALSKDRGQRYPSMKDLEEAILSLKVPEAIQLRQAASEPSVKELRPGSRAMIGYTVVLRAEEQRRKRTFRKAAIALAAAAAIGGAAAGLAGYERLAEPRETHKAFAPKHDGGKSEGVVHDDNTQDIREGEK